MNPDEAIIDIYAKLSFYEFLLEVSHANTFAGDNLALAEFRREIIKKIRFNPVLNPDSDVDLALLVQDRQIEIAERFFEKVVARARDIERE